MKRVLIKKHRKLQRIALSQNTRPIPVMFMYTVTSRFLIHTCSIKSQCETFHANARFSESTFYKLQTASQSSGRSTTLKRRLGPSNTPVWSRGGYPRGGQGQKLPENAQSTLPLNHQLIQSNIHIFTEVHFRTHHHTAQKREKIALL